MCMGTVGIILRSVWDEEEPLRSMAEGEANCRGADFRKQVKFSSTVQK